MAELKLTEEENAAISWLDMSDDALGKLVRKTCVQLPDLMKKNETEMGKIWVTTCGMLLCNMAAEANSATTTFTYNGLTLKDKNQGDWKVTIKRVKAPNAPVRHGPKAGESKP